ncbi:hypothetical protein AB4Z32_25655 [Massilia sp. 2TAF26]|uniref:hypothetical protein n=1 Tax=Massilia sp. 2TAF26 TaxID=3233012 RepID=UPI003F99666A
MPNILVSDVVTTFMGPNQSENFDRNQVYDTCRIQSCDEKLGVVFNEAGDRLLGLGIRNFRCYYYVIENAQTLMKLPQSPPIRCDTTPTYRIFIFRYEFTVKNLEKEVNSLHKLKVWAAAKGPGEIIIDVIRAQ